MLLKSIVGNAEVDKLVSNRAEKALLRHLWYIVPEMIPFSSQFCGFHRRKRIAEKLLLRKPFEPVVCLSTRFCGGFGKPDFPFNVDKSTSLSKLYQRFMFIFHIMQIDSSFLLENSASWRSLNSYQSGRKNTGAVM